MSRVKKGGLVDMRLNSCLADVESIMKLSDGYTEEEHYVTCLFYMQNENTITEKGYNRNDFIKLFHTLVEKVQVDKKVPHDVAFKLTLEGAASAFFQCLDDIHHFLPSKNGYTEEQNKKVCQFLIENTNDIIKTGFGDPEHFLVMFNKIFEKELEKPENKEKSQEDIFNRVFNGAHLMIKL